LSLSIHVTPISKMIATDSRTKLKQAAVKYDTAVFETLQNEPRLLLRHRRRLKRRLASRLHSTDRDRYDHLAEIKLEGAVSLLVLLLILLLLFGGGGAYYGGPYVGGSLGGIILLVLLVMLLTGRLR